MTVNCNKAQSSTKHSSPRYYYNILVLLKERSLLNISHKHLIFAVCLQHYGLHDLVESGDCCLKHFLILYFQMMPRTHCLQLCIFAVKVDSGIGIISRSLSLPQHYSRSTFVQFLARKVTYVLLSLY